MTRAAAPSIPYGEGFDWRGFARRIRETPEFSRLAFHPRAGEIAGDRQFLFDGSVVAYPWGDDGLHLLVELTRGAPEPQEILPFLDALDLVPDDALVLELGAGWAFYSLIAGRRLPGARLLLVEANPRLAEVARRNLALNGLTDRATVVEAAAWDAQGESVMFREAGYGSHVHARGEKAAPTVSIDGLMRERGLERVNVAHLDVQGAEARVLDGAAEALRRRAIDFVFVGTHGHDLHRRCREMLEAAGYRTTVDIDLDATASGDGVLVCEAPRAHASPRPRASRTGQVGAAFSNLTDCARYGCRVTPWEWACRWVLERAALSGAETVCDLGAGDNAILHKAFRKSAKRAYLIDNLLLPGDKRAGGNVAAILGDIGALPLADASIDVAVSVSVLEHLTVEHRLRAMREIQRVLKPGGRALLSIGTLLRVSPEAETLLATLPFFTERNCAVHFPLDFAALLAAAPRLRPLGGSDLNRLPGFSGFDEAALLADRNLCVERFIDYPEVASIPALSPIVWCETAIALQKA